MSAHQLCTLALLLLLVVVAPAVNGFPSPLKSEPVDPEANYTPLELITSKGYLGEEHWVKTQDGYILGLHRIPTSRANHTKGPRPVFFLQHGLLCSSTNWIINLANQSLGFILADQGFDVWMGNIRGNTYSKNHTTLKVNSREFWNFTFDEHAQKDLPAMLEYVLKVTGQKKLFYVGHSQGTVMGFAGFTFNPEVAKMIQIFFALAPVTTVQHIQGAFKVISDYRSIVEPVLNTLTDGEFFPNNFLINFFAKNVCTLDMSVEGLCGDVIFLVCGFDRKNLNETRLPVYYTHTPAGTSVKNAMHFAQEVGSGRFAMYDYGSKEANEKQYGVNPSPAYNVSEMTVPMALFTGSQDWLADPQDVARLLPILNSTGHLLMHKNVDYYSHLDFIWGIDAANVVYKDIVELAQKHLN